MNRRARSAVVLLLILLPAGCGAGKGNVQGTVTFDGQPVPNGTITFVKTDGELVREGSVIKDGSFKAQLPPGKYKIEVHARKVTGVKKQKGFNGADEEVELTEELFPERYNTKTELTEEIKSGSGAIKLDLTSKK